MDSSLIWYGLWLLIVATLFWAAVWWWLPAMFGDRERREDDKGERQKRERGSTRDDVGPTR